jgi:serpin B
MSIRLSHAAFCFAALAAAACGGSDSPPSEPSTPAAEVAKSNLDRRPPSAPSASVQTLTANNAKFGFDLYRKIAPSENFFFSPHSISIALAMAYAGAAGTTKSEMATALSFLQEDGELHDAFNTLDQALESRGKDAQGADGQPFRLRVSNAAWAQRDYPLLQSYLDTLATYYGSGVHLLDFITDAEGGRKTINLWVSDQTEERIPELLAPGTINPDTRLVLTNAVYFNASWEEPFKPEATANGAFTRLDGSSVDVPLMHQNVGHGYGEGNGWQAVEIAYDKREVSMLVVLPDAGTFEQFEAALDAGKLAEITSAIGYNYSVELTLPKLEIRSKARLRQPLEDLGMPTAFTASADFSAMNGDGGLQIQDVVHEAFVKVNEAGTEAAAATAVIIGVTGVPQPVTFSATRPFLFLIRDTATGAVVFVGRVVDPSK